MRSKVFLPDHHCLQLDSVAIDEQNSIVEVVVHSAAENAACPRCGRASTRVHSWYQRRLTDLPWQGLSVSLTWRTRKFFCTFDDCHQRIFVERRPEVAAPYGRRTERLGLALRCIALACGGEGGARLANRLGMTVSPDSLLREIRRASYPENETPRVLGVDDWAFRKGQRYGTVLIDLERGQPVDLLPDREPDSLKTWLQENPGVEIISRDRADCYIKGATAGAPKAIQVADRFHLVKNLRESLARLIDRHAKTLRTAFEQMYQDNAKPEPIKQATHVEADRLSPANPTAAAQKRLQLYDKVVGLHQDGMSMREISRRLGVDRESVARFIHLGPDRLQRSYASTTDQCVDYLWKRWKQGCHNACQLTREIQKQGFTVSYYSVRRRVKRWRRGLSENTPKLPPDLCKPTPNKLSWLLFKIDSQLTDAERSLKNLVLSKCPEIQAGWDVATEFLSLLKSHVEDRFSDWLEAALSPSVPRELRRFAAGIERDADAVLAAIKLTWSNGQAEGQINRLKTLKRQMYGRASFDLLRLRFLVSI